MKSITIQGTKRESVGKKSTKALRDAELVPCVVYGGTETLNFSAEERSFKEIGWLLQKGGLFNILKSARGVVPFTVKFRVMAAAQPAAEVTCSRTCPATCRTFRSVQQLPR